MKTHRVDIGDRLTALEQIYAVYDGFCSSLALACQKNCAHCCTTNVTLTTLEGYRVMAHLASTGNLDMIAGLEKMTAIDRYQPRVSINRLAELYAAEAKVPEEEMDVDAQACGLLTDNLCLIYDARPFGCRCFVSRKNCAETGYADIDDFTASVNTVFMQTIEHLDADGCTGNLIDVLQIMAHEQNRQAYADGRLSCEPNGLIVNWELKVLMIPPEHRSNMEPILQELRQIKV